MRVRSSGVGVPVFLVVLGGLGVAARAQGTGAPGAGRGAVGVPGPGSPGPARARGEGDGGRAWNLPPFPIQVPRLPETLQAGDQDGYIRITADSTIQLTRDLLEFTGHVRAHRKGLTLATDQVRYDRNTRQLDAVGNIRVEDPLFSLTCGKLTLYTPHDIGVAWENPRIVQARKDPDGRIAERTEIQALQLTFYSGEDRVEGLERVRIFRWVRRGEQMTLDFKVSAQALETNLLTRRSVFKGTVLVESPTYRVRASRLILDQGPGRFLAVGSARVEGFNERGEVTNVVEGNKLVHFIREQRTIISGGVSGVLEPDKQRGARKIDVQEERRRDEEIPVLPLEYLDADEGRSRGPEGESWPGY